MNNVKVNLLEERLITFSFNVIKIIESLPNTDFGSTMRDQLTRSCISPTLNYGEARGAESRRDFVHKMKVCLKELRETFNSLRLSKKYLEWKSSPIHEIDGLISENNELISIFVASIKTSLGNNNEQNK